MGRILVESNSPPIVQLALVIWIGPRRGPSPNRRVGFMASNRAGFDTPAYRFRQGLRSTKVFEVDYGPTQEYKKRQVREVIGAPPPNVVYVPIDFTRQNLSEVPSGS